MPNDRFSDKIRDADLRKCIVVAEVAFVMYFRDVRQLVKAGVEMDMKRVVEDSDSDDCSEQVKSQRKRNLKKWLKNGNGILDYEDDNYATLLRAVATTPHEIAKGLPGMEEQKMTTMAFATTLYNMVMDRHNHGLEAPVLAKGTFYPALTVAIQHIRKRSTTRKQSAFAIEVLRLTTELLKIRFVPWKLPSSGRGHPNKVPVWNSWMSLGVANEVNEQRAILLRPEEALQRAALDAQRDAMARDVNVPWSAAAIQLTELLRYLDSPMLPSDWVIPQQSTDYVRETYEYVRGCYDRKKGVHRLALLVGIVMSRSLPNIFAPIDTGTRYLGGTTTQAETRQAVQRVPWISKAKTKGMKDGSIFMSMFMTFVIGLYETESPLRKYMKTHQDSLGNPWTDKHSE
jgi:hypothetical protein